MPYSDAVAELIDQEVETLIKEAARRAEVVLVANRKSLEDLKDALLKDETLEEAAVDEILQGTKLPKEAKLHA